MPGRFPWLRYGVHVLEERRASNKRTQAGCSRGGWGTSIIDNPGAHEEDLLVAAGSWDHRKKKSRRTRERARNDGGSDEDAALVRRGQYLREGLGSTSFSATERNCTGWGTLIYWVITDLGAKRARGVWAFSPARVLRDLFRAKWLERMRWIRMFRNLIKKSAWKSIRDLPEEVTIVH